MSILQQCGTFDCAWHGGGLTGVTYETTPDGREGWLNIFVRKGWDGCVAHAIEQPIFVTYADPFERFRIGEGDGSWNPDPTRRKLMPRVQLPVGAYADYMKLVVARWLSTDDAVIVGYIALVA